VAYTDGMSVCILKKKNHLVVLLFAIMACMTVLSVIKILFEGSVRFFFTLAR